MAAYTLRQLKYFVTTVECGSVAEASRKLYIAQPSISTAIKGLEDSFGLQLFIRHHAQGVSLTPGGSRFYKKALELLRMAREFEQNALADNDVVAGQIDPKIARRPASAFGGEARAADRVLGRPADRRRGGGASRPGLGRHPQPG